MSNMRKRGKEVMLNTFREDMSMTRKDSSDFRDTLGKFPFTGGGSFVPSILLRYDAQFMPWGRRIPTFTQMVCLLEELASAFTAEVSLPVEGE